eukprot:m.134529 g.134529  ORF g.134529 m.134529 type:complete len:51 (-) comp9625_c0_seq1:169-321(-)
MLMYRSITTFYVGSIGFNVAQLLQQMLRWAFALTTSSFVIKRRTQMLNII